MKTLNKNYILLIIGMIFITAPTYGQESWGGIKGGVNLSNLYIDEVDDENMRVGFHLGAYAQILNESETLGFQPEIAFSTKGARATYDIATYEGEVKFNLNYIDLPLLMVFKLGESAEIHFGGYAAYLLSSNVTTEGDFGSGEDELDKDNFNSFDYGLAGGFALNFDPMSVGIRYNYGLQKIAESDIAEEILDNSKNGNGQIFVAFNLN